MQQTPVCAEIFSVRKGFQSVKILLQLCPKASLNTCRIGGPLSNLEMAIKSVVYWRVTDEHDQLECEHRQLRIKYFELKQQHDELADKMRYFTKVRPL